MFELNKQFFEVALPDTPYSIHFVFRNSRVELHMSSFDNT